MESWQIEQLRRSVVMVESDTVGPLTKQAALDLIEELSHCRQETDRYREVVAEVRRLLDSLGGSV